MLKITLLLIPIAVLYVVATIYVIIQIFILGHYLYGVILIAAFIFSLMFYFVMAKLLIDKFRKD